MHPSLRFQVAVAAILLAALVAVARIRPGRRINDLADVRSMVSPMATKQRDETELEPPSAWRIPAPDAVIYTSDEPHLVPAEGLIENKVFYTKTNFPEERWIRAAELRPENAEVVSKMSVWIVPPTNSLEVNEARPTFTYSPGAPATEFADGAGVSLPAGSIIRFRIHYTPNGRAVSDRSSLGLVFADPARVKRQVAIDVDASVDGAAPAPDR